MDVSTLDINVSQLGLYLNASIFTKLHVFSVCTAVCCIWHNKQWWYSLRKVMSQILYYWTSCSCLPKVLHNLYKLLCHTLHKQRCCPGC